MEKFEKRIGLIAGYGQFPKLFSDTAREKGYGVYAIAFKDQADEDLDSYVDKALRVYLGELGKIISFFKENMVEQIVFAGGIRKIQMFSDLHLDEAALALLATITDTRDDAIMRAFATALENEGLSVKASTWLLPELLAPFGCYTKRKPTEEEKADLDFGFRLAKTIGELDIGQCIVVAKGSVLAVEAIDGTDATILRGGSLGKGNAVVVKVKKPGQDMRFDLPAIGRDTINTMVKAGATALGVDAGESVVFDYREMVELADKHEITILGMGKDDKV